MTCNSHRVCQSKELPLHAAPTPFSENSDFDFMPVSSESFVFQLGSSWGFTAFTISLGSSYFQRLVCAIPQLEFAVRQNPK